MNRKQKLLKQLLEVVLLRGKATRPELIEHFGVRAATIFELVDELKKSGLLIEPERRGKKTGRKAPDLECNPDAGSFLGVDFQPQRTVGVLTDAQGKILLTEELTCDRTSLNDCRREIAELIRRLKANSGLAWARLQGIGFADPGMVDVDRGVSLEAVSIPGWKNAATGEWLRNEYHLPVGIWPETMVKAFMEYRLRQADNPPESLFLVALSGGVGGAFVQNGQLFEGATGQGMELGHLVIEPDGPICKCGNRGCVETLTGESGLRNLLQQAVEQGVKTTLDPQNFQVKDFIEAVKVDKSARIIADQLCTNLGRALSAVVTLLNPEMVVFAGELTGLGALLFHAVQRQLEINCFAGAVKNLKLELSRLDEFDTARGAAIRMRDKLWLE